MIFEGSVNNLDEILKIDKVVFGKSKTKKDIEAKLSLCKNVHISIGKVENHTVGYGVGYEEKGKYYLWMTAVLPEYRKQGIGTGIIDDQIKYAATNGYAEFEVKTSNKWKNMLKLLISKDFEITGYKTNEWGTDSAIWLTRQVNK